MTTEAYIYDAVRTPRSKGKPNGSLNEVKSVELAAGLLRELQRRHDLDTSRVDDVILGCTHAVMEQGSDIGKAVPMQAGWDEGVTGVQLDRFCASGLEAVNTAAQKVRSGWDHLFVAGGVDSLSRVPLGSSGGTLFSDPGFILKNGIVPQGIAADLLATVEGWTREDVDAYSLESQKRAAHARDSGYFDKSVVPVVDKNGITILDKDNFIKPDTTLEILGKLPAAFEKAGVFGLDDMAIAKYPEVEKINHVHSAGSSSGIVDGAAAVLVGSEQIGKELDLTPRGRIVAGTVVACCPIIMMTGPGPASKKCLQMAGMSKEDIDLWEINEAFASAAMRYMKDLDIPHEVTNVNGGAIAMGHPLGATGAMLVSTMLDELERRNLKRGMVSLCVGAGMGISTIIERV